MSVFFTRRGPAPVLGKLASDYAVGESVFLNVNGVSREFLVVNQGIPSASSLYDSSCDGTWLLMKDIYESRVWHSSNANAYFNSTIHSYLNSTFLGLFDANVQSAIKQVKIPCYASTGISDSVNSGANGLAAKIFLLSGYEVGWTRSNSSYFPIDGACLSYFSGLSATDSKRIGYRNGTATAWWLRSAYTLYSGTAWLVTTSGGSSGSDCAYSYGIRPALVFPYNALFDPNTNEFKNSVR